MKNEHVFELLQNWYSSQCDGDWEHEYGIKIDTLDNPGWAVDIDLVGTDCENKAFTEIDQQFSSDNWCQCSVNKGKFRGAGGPKNLTDIIKIFLEWKIKERKIL